MEKIISLFQRNYDEDRLIRDEITPGAEWVVAREGCAMTKLDGTCCLVKRGLLFKRYEAKRGRSVPFDSHDSEYYEREALAAFLVLVISLVACFFSWL